MEHRILGLTGAGVSVVGLGTWQLGADWGDVSTDDALSLLAEAQAGGVTFFDTADVYGDGRSEALIGRYLRTTPSPRPFVATKMGRRAVQVRTSYSWDNFRIWTDRSRENLGVDTLDLVQLHCPPSDVIESGEVYDNLDRLVQEGRIAHYGVSVETCEQALAAMERPHLATVQIILNVFRRKPLDKVLPAAAAKGVGIIARVPLASGLLSGRYTAETTFAPTDHRNYNRDGASFDVGETFSGVDYDDGVRAAADFTALCRELGPVGASPAQVALRWIIDRGVTTVIPGARNTDQARSNAEAAALPPLGDELDTALAELYDRWFRAAVHHRW